MEDQVPNDPRAIEWARREADLSWAEIRTELVAAAQTAKGVQEPGGYTLRNALAQLATATAYLERFESGDAHPGVTWDRVEEILSSAENMIGQVRNERRLPRQNEY